ncbi:MAG: hypothetical protein IT165_04955 [Bryobacterales bacterium]|nr:hypothetical protein [Bryobacterales bacterium]
MFSGESHDWKSLCCSLWVATREDRRKGLLFLLGASLAGFAANLIPYPVTDGVDMLFGGVFSYLVALTLGPLPGAIAALFVYLTTGFFYGAILMGCSPLCSKQLPSGR